MNAKHFSMSTLIILLTASVVSADRPNIVLFLTDDQGYGDLVCFGSVN